MSIAPKNNIIPFQPEVEPAYPVETVLILAHLAWQGDECPGGRFREYLHESELQLRATHHLMMEELADPLRLKGRLSGLVG